MQVHLHWDDDAETIVRWEFDGVIGMTDYMIPVNETAGMGIMAGGRADVIVNIGWKMPLPNRPLPQIKKPLQAARHYGLGYTVMVVKNPLARWIINTGLLDSDEMREACYVVTSLHAARDRLAALRRDDPPPGIEMGD